MTSALGLGELLLVLIGVMGWGAYELWSLRRGTRRSSTGKPDRDREA